MQFGSIYVTKSQSIFLKYDQGLFFEIKKHWSFSFVLLTIPTIDPKLYIEETEVFVASKASDKHFSGSSKRPTT